MPATITEQQLLIDGHVILEQLPPEVTVVADPTATGVFLRVHPWTARDRLGPAGESAVPATGSRMDWRLGRPVAMARWLACARTSPFWMEPRVGVACGAIPRETQSLLFQRSDGRHVLVIPLLDDPLRFSLHGTAAGLALVGESNDAFTPGSAGIGAFVAIGDDPYVLHERAAAAVARHLPGCRLRRDKPLPDFIDWFGWCTWDAFYQEVDPAGVRAGLDSLRAAGVPPRLLIIDDGWLSSARMPGGGHQLTAFAPNGKFAGTFAPVTRMAKEEFGVRCVLAWHALLGSWGGTSPRHLAGHGMHEVAKCYGAEVLGHSGQANHTWGAAIGLPSAAGAASYYDTWHRLLAGQGIDGVKVDVQGLLESCATGTGGRVGLIATFRAALEASVARHFHGRLLNCMSHGSETWYLSPGSNLTRFSGDFYPENPETHGPHLWTNAALGLWFGEFQHADWDMFHSQHPQAALHAAARAISGGPVYVSDKPGRHDPAVLRRLVLSDGSVARCTAPARLGPASLYADPLAEAVPLTVWNSNPCNAVLGVFHVRRTGTPLRTSVTQDDVPGCQGEHILYHDGRLVRDAALDLHLEPLGHAIVTVAPVRAGLALIGLQHLFNPGAAITACRDDGATADVSLRDGGELLVWCTRRPSSVDGADGPLAHAWHADSGLLSITLPSGAPTACRIRR